MPNVTPADVLAQRHRVVLNNDADGFADLFAPDAVVEWPMAGPGAPTRLVGREAIREYTRQFTAALTHVEGYEVTELYQTQDPEVVVVEMHAQALTATGQRIAANSIQVLRIRAGQIVLFRDFAPPRTLDKVLR